MNNKLEVAAGENLLEPGKDCIQGECHSLMILTDSTVYEIDLDCMNCKEKQSEGTV